MLINLPSPQSPLKNNENNQVNVYLDLRFNFDKRSKKKFFAEIIEVTPRKLLGNKTHRTSSEPNIRIRRKRGRKKKKYLENKLDSCDIEVSGAISDSIRKNDIDKSVNQYSIELEGLDKSSSMNMHMHLNKNIKSTEEISSQNTSKEQNKQSFSLANLNLINDNNLNNVSKKYKNIHQKHRKHDTKGNGYYIRIDEEDEDNDIGFRVNNQKNRQEENVEILSIASTPEAKKRLRHNNINQYQKVYNLENTHRRGRKRKNFGQRNNNINNEEEFIDLELSQNNRKNSNISKKSKESESEFYSDIKLVQDDNYFSYDTQYIKYNPIQNLKNISKYDANIKSYIEDIPSIYTIPRINPKLEDLFPKISESLKKIGMIIYDKQERELELYKGSFPLVDEKKKIEVMVPCYDDNQVFKSFSEKKKKFPKLQKFDEDNDIMTDDEQLGMEIKRGNECLTKFIQEVKENKNYIAEKLSRNNIKKENEEDNVGEIEERIGEEDEEEEEESDEEDDQGQIIIGDEIKEN